MSELWSIRGLSKSRRDTERHFRVCLPHLLMATGDRVALVGESGSGKSTLLSLLALATQPDDAAEFRFGDADIGAAWRNDDIARLEDLRARSIAYLPQRDGLIEFLSVRQNIQCSAQLGRVLPVRDMDRIAAALGLGELLGAMPAALSGGQRQRAAVACALVRRPRTILADEPTAALDGDNAARVIDCLWQLGDSLGCGMIFATHQPEQLAGRGFRILRAQIERSPGGTASTFAEAA